MKRFASIILALILVAALATTAFAENNVEVTFNVTEADESYEFVIPSALAAGTAKGETQTFEFKNVNVVSSREITMTVASANSWKLANDKGDTLAYSLMDASDAALEGTVVLSLTGAGLEADASASASYYALISDSLGSVKHLGTFSDTLTFTVAVSDIAVVE